MSGIQAGLPAGQRAGPAALAGCRLPVRPAAGISGVIAGLFAAGFFSTVLGDAGTRRDSVPLV